MRAVFSLLLIALHHALLGAFAATYDVSASGNGLDLSEAMNLAQAGDTVSLADGTYDVPIVSQRDGDQDSPITVVGGSGAIIMGDFESRNVLIRHSFITLKVGATTVVKPNEVYLVYYCRVLIPTSFPPGSPRCHALLSYLRRTSRALLGAAVLRDSESSISICLRVVFNEGRPGRRPKPCTCKRCEEEFVCVTCCAECSP